jgi:two-component system, chemotaxis family, protein-glutamate methylesterase/glutaminase
MVFARSGLMPSGQKLRVLIVDDSAFMCKLLQSMISADPEIEVVGTARDGREGIALSDALCPDVITMDINMPGIDGLQATEVIMSTSPRPIIIVSSESHEGAEPTIRALSLGAIDFIPKPASGSDVDMNALRMDLCSKLKVAARVKLEHASQPSALARQLGYGDWTMPIESSPAPSRATQAAQPTFAMPPTRSTGRTPVVVLAASTGGPSTLSKLLPMFPSSFPGAVLLVQHVAPAFTEKFSEQLGLVTAMRVKQAEASELLRPGTVHVCPGSHHMRISPTGRILLDDGPRIGGHRPCASVTMETAAIFAGSMTIGVVLTGIGNDGAKGVRAIKAAGGYNIAQDDSSCVMFQMPAEAIATGCVDQVLPLDGIYTAIEKRVATILGAARIGL